MDNKETEKKGKRGLRRLFFGSSSSDKKKDRTNSSATAKSNENNNVNEELNNNKAKKESSSSPGTASESTNGNKGPSSGIFKFGRSSKKEKVDGEKSKKGLASMVKGKLSSTTKVKGIRESGGSKTSPNQITSLTQPMGKRMKLKRGKKPKFRRIERHREARKTGNIKRPVNKYYPGDVDYIYATPKEVWIATSPSVASGKKTTKGMSSKDFPFGLSAMIIRDETDK